MRKIVATIALLNLSLLAACGDEFFPPCDWSRRIFMACEIALGSTPCLGAISDERHAPSECWQGASYDDEGTGITEECIEAWGWECVDACRDAQDIAASGGTLDAQTQTDYEGYCFQ